MKGRIILAVGFAALLTLSASSAVVVGTEDGGVVTPDGQTLRSAPTAEDVEVTFGNETFYGGVVTLDSITVPEESTVVLHDSRALEGNLTGSILDTRTVSGTETDVRFYLPFEHPWYSLVGLESGDTTTWMVTVRPEGSETPYTRNGSVLNDTATITVGQSAEVTFDDKQIERGATSITVDSVFLPAGGYLFVDAPDGQFATVDYIAPGRHHNVTVGMPYPSPVEESGEFEATVYQEEYISTGSITGLPYYSDGTPVSDTANVTAGDGDAPTADIALSSPVSVDPTRGESVAVEAGDRVTLTETGSTDPDGDITGYEWRQTSGPPVRFPTDAPYVSFTAPAAPSETTLGFELGVTDRRGYADRTTVDIVVDADDSAEPDASFAVTDFTAPATVERGDAMTVLATVANVGDATETQTVEYRVDTDGDGTLERVGISTPVTLAPGEERAVSFEVPTRSVQPGTYRHGVVSAGVDLTSELTVQAPATHYQVDFVAGEPMDLNASSLYADEDRLVRWALGNTRDGFVERGTAWASEGVRACVDAPHVDRTGDTATVEFTVADGCENVTLSLVSYTTPADGFSRETADEQELFDATTMTFGPGEHTITVSLPTGNATDASTATGTVGARVP